MSRIILHTELNPEDNAMLQALYSRSASSVVDHLKKLEQVGSSNFMSQYYLGYGHASIGDCGSETMYFEGISMLAAKAIEDNPLFVGQECSSRYIDFSTQPFYVPFEGTLEGDLIKELYDHYRHFYISSLEPLKAALKLRFPIKEGEKSGIYEKAIAARAFDVLRGFLPASATTNVAWTGRLSNAGEHLAWMMHHPLGEIRNLGALAYAKLQEKFPNSFKQNYAEIFGTARPIKDSLLEIEGRETFDFMSDNENFYLPYIFSVKSKGLSGDISGLLSIEVEEDAAFSIKTFPGVKSRPKRTKLHKHSLVSQTRMFIAGLVDFGSFRDIQRHRNGYCGMPILTNSYGMHKWYLENLPEDLRENADILLDKVETTYKKVSKLSNDASEAIHLQYLLPMGYLVPLILDYSLQEAVYVAELRSGKTVHATLRPIAQAIGKELEELGIPVFYDKDESDWTVKRGEQDIVAKS